MACLQNEIQAVWNVLFITTYEIRAHMPGFLVKIINVNIQLLSIYAKISESIWRKFASFTQNDKIHL